MSSDETKWGAEADNAARLLRSAGIMPTRCKGQDWPTMVEILARALADDLPHGYCLIGGAGCGKTTLLRLIRRTCRTSHNPGHEPGAEYDFRAAMDCVYEFQDAGGNPVREAAWSSRGFLLDDLGVEPTGNHYGQKREYLHEVLEMRWRKYERSRAPTFITTNLSMAKLEMRYGQRLTSRIKGIAKVITLETPDQRRVTE